MIVDFSRINLKDNPLLILRTNSGKPLGVLAYAFNVEAEICYNEISKLSFRLPGFIEGGKTPFYDDVIGTRIIDVKGVGQFILTNPVTNGDGIKEIKSCAAYSLEYELTYKQIFLEHSTYNFWNPVAQGGTILKYIMGEIPSWSIGVVDSALTGKYRTFDVSGENLYNFIKSTVQDAYQCIFEFDTYNRKVNVRAASSAAATQPVYFSFDNLIKEIEIEENSENIITCLDVSGAGGADIRSVNPMGINKIYDYSYFMNTTNFSRGVIDAYNSWKTTFNAYRAPYYNLTVEQALKTQERITEEAALTTLNGELKNLENRQAVTIQAIAQALQPGSALTSINSQLSAKRSQINAKKALINSVNSQINALKAQMTLINNAAAFSAFFTPSQLLELDKFTREDSLQEPSFVATSVRTYNVSGVSNTITNLLWNITGSKITKTIDSINKDVYTIRGGRLTAGGAVALGADLVSGSCIVSPNNTFLFSAYLKAGTIGAAPFPSGNVSLTGTVSAANGDAAADPALPGIFYGTSLSFNVSSARFYFTQNVTAYEERAVEWDLYDYGAEVLGKLAAPAYTFSVKAADFLYLDEFAAFKNKIRLGDKVYLDLETRGVLKPIVIKCVIDFDDLSDFSIEFGNSYKVSDGEFKLVDLLEQSVSMGNKLNFNQFSYNAWAESGASTEVGDFMKSAIDVGVNAILSSSGQAPTLDDAGLRIRKPLPNGEYSPKQIWANNNSIMMTSNGWQSAEIAIGEFTDANAGTLWGIVAPNIVGTLLAGNNLVIESQKKDGGKAVFRVDGNGAALYNSTFDIFNRTNTQITLNPYTGFAIGKYPLYTMPNYAINENNAKFWVDMNGNVHMKGTLHAVNGTFSGELSAATGTFSGVVQASDFKDLSGVSMLKAASQQGVPATGYRFKPDYLELKGLTIKNSANETTFAVDLNGNVTVKGSIKMGSGSSISWESVGHDPLTEDAHRLAKAADDITQTIIDGTSVISPKIVGGTITGNTIKGGTIDGTKITGTTIEGATIEGGIIKAGRYYDTPGKNFLEVGADGNGSFGFFRHPGGNGDRLFGAMGSSYKTDLYIKTNVFLSNEGDRKMKAMGEWTFGAAQKVSFGAITVDFTETKVTGLSVQAKFA